MNRLQEKEKWREGGRESKTHTCPDHWPAWVYEVSERRVCALLNKLELDITHNKQTLYEV